MRHEIARPYALDWLRVGALSGSFAAHAVILDTDGRAKLHIIRQGLAVRKSHAPVFHGGVYTPLYADGGYEANVIAFSLGAAGRSVVAVAPRLFARRLGDAKAPIGEGFWAESRLALPEGAYVDVMTQRHHNGGSARLADLLAEFPVALLVRR